MKNDSKKKPIIKTWREHYDQKKSNKKLNWQPTDQINVWQNYLRRLILVLIGGFIYYVALQWFILGNTDQRHTEFLSTGSSGILLTITNIAPGTTNYYFLMQIILNVPLMIYGWYRIGMITTIYTTIFILVQYAYSFIPDPFIFGHNGLNTNYALQLLSGVFAGIIGAIGSCINYIAGSTAGGTDILIFDINSKKGTQIGRLNIIFNCVILSIGFASIAINNLARGSETNWSDFGFIIFGTFIYIIMYGFSLDYLYPKGKKLTIFIILPKEKIDKFNETLAKYNFYRTYTIVPGKGGREKQDKVVLITVITAWEYSQLEEIVKVVDKNGFIFSHKITKLSGRFNKFNFD